jgi:hypothetical protein
MVTSQQERIETLEKRLNDGFTRIGEAMQQGLTVDNWHTYWQELLAEYVALNDALAAAPLEQAEMAGLPRREAA